MTIKELYDFVNKIQKEELCGKVNIDVLGGLAIIIAKAEDFSFDNLMCFLNENSKIVQTFKSLALRNVEGDNYINAEVWIEDER